MFGWSGHGSRLLRSVDRSDGKSIDQKTGDSHQQAVPGFVRFTNAKRLAVSLATTNAAMDIEITVENLGFGIFQ